MASNKPIVLLLSDIESFLRRVPKNKTVEGCWIWTGSIYNDGYRVIKFPGIVT